VISAVGHETDFTLCDFAADKRAPTPSAAAEIAVPNAEDILYTVQTADMRLRRAMNQKISVARERLDRLASSRVLKNPQNVIDDKRMMLLREEQMLHEKMKAVLQRKGASLGEKAAKLNALNPLAVLSRGYAAIFDENNQVVKSTEDVKAGDDITLAMADGKISATVKTIIKKEEI
jgi:exodeoxyribonuclease VII large subunit